MHYLKKQTFLHKSLRIYHLRHKKNIKNLFGWGLDFTSRNWLSPIQTEIRAISQKIHIFAQYTPNKIVLALQLLSIWCLSYQHYSNLEPPSLYGRTGYSLNWSYIYLLIVSNTQASSWLCSLKVAAFYRWKDDWSARNEEMKVLASR